MMSMMIEGKRIVTIDSDQLLAASSSPGTVEEGGKKEYTVLYSKIPKSVTWPQCLSVERRSQDTVSVYVCSHLWSWSTIRYRAQIHRHFITKTATAAATIQTTTITTSSGMVSWYNRDGEFECRTVTERAPGSSSFRLSGGEISPARFGTVTLQYSTDH